MIKVDNSPEKRFFYLKGYEDKQEFIHLKKEIIDSIESKSYAQLKTLRDKDYADQFSVFIFYEAIQEKLNSISSVAIKQQLQNIDWFEALVGSIKEIRVIIQKNSHLLANPTLPHFKQYKDTFEDLYISQLSQSQHDLKKEFFVLFNDINVCPYCNRNFINPIYKFDNLGGDNKKQSPDIEHFFPKSLYPFLSLSISNLLPSCSFCNKIKSNVDTYQNKCRSPYEIENEDFVFDFELEDSYLKKVILKNSDNFKNSDILHLEALYNEVHSEYINDIFGSIIKYPDVYKERLQKLDVSEEDYKKFFRNYFYEQDFNKHPLSKMTKDLYTYLKHLT